MLEHVIAFFGYLSKGAAFTGSLIFTAVSKYFEISFLIIESLLQVLDRIWLVLRAIVDILCAVSMAFNFVLNLVDEFLQCIKWLVMLSPRFVLFLLRIAESTLFELAILWGLNLMEKTLLCLMVVFLGMIIYNHRRYAAPLCLYILWKLRKSVDSLVRRLRRRRPNLEHRRPVVEDWRRQFVRLGRRQGLDMDLRLRDLDLDLDEEPQGFWPNLERLEQVEDEELQDRVPRPRRRRQRIQPLELNQNQERLRYQAEWELNQDQEQDQELEVDEEQLPPLIPLEEVLRLQQLALDREREQLPPLIPLDEVLRLQQLALDREREQLPPLIPLDEVMQLQELQEQQELQELQEVNEEQMPELIEDDDQELGGNLACVVCMHYSRKILLLPCRHFCLCKECFARVQRLNSCCPICRLHIASFIVVFV
ncbi:hypothetical protein KR018_011147 [Drosophila ironensis]|nr:hypothetical protein KR018_011147 [Drosophila ironensis]